MPPRRKKQSKKTAAAKNAAVLAKPTKEGPVPENRGGMKDIPDMPLDVLKEVSNATSYVGSWYN